jgi:nitroimidazol reductase NimA-like FMN-containing flavoprotein (pyridoxamine 5'-phosphate oxidase superfamily)
MADLSMGVSERESFLQEPHLAVLAVEREGRAPLAVPIWYAYDPGGLVTVHTARGQLKTQALEASGRYTLCVQVDTPPYRYVSVDGPIVAIEPIGEEERVAMVRRYFDVDMADEYLRRTDANAANDVAVRMRPQAWRTVDFARIGF